MGNVIQNELYLALKFFQGSPQLAKLWNIGQKLWQRDFPSVYQALVFDWSDELKPLIEQIRGFPETKQNVPYLLL